MIKAFLLIVLLAGYGTYSAISGSAPSGEAAGGSQSANVQPVPASAKQYVAPNQPYPPSPSLRASSAHATAADALAQGAAEALAADLPASASAMAGLARMAGVSVEPLPPVGCSGSPMSKERAHELLRSLQEPARSTVARVLDLSAPAWNAQMYVGSDGTGVCLPTHQRLIKFSGLSLVERTEDVDIAQKIGETIKSIGEVIPRWFEPSRR